MKPPVTVRVTGPGWEAVLEVPGLFGDAAGVAARLRAGGVVGARKKGLEVHIKSDSEYAP